MRAPLLLFSALSLSILLFACHKSGSGRTGDGYTGHWRMIQLTGGPAIDVIRIDREHVLELNLFPDSTRQDIYNGKVVGTGTWSVRSQDSSGNPINIMVFAYSPGTGSAPLVYQVSLSRTQLVLKMIPDVGYKAVYERN